MKTILKRIFIICTVVLIFVLALTSCALDDVFTNKTRSFIDKILMGESYTAEHKSADDVYNTLMVAGNELYCARKTEESVYEIYLYCDEEKGEYFYVTKSTVGEEVIINKVSLPKNEYISTYTATYAQYSQTSELFHYRHILDMMKTVEDNHYMYSEEEKIQSHYKKTEYSIKAAGNELVLLQETRDEDWSSEQVPEGEEGTGESVVTATIRTTYKNVGKTVITIPKDVLDK